MSFFLFSPICSLLFVVVQEAVEETMKNVPLMEQIVEYYSGPERITAKQQMEELDRIAKTLPKSVPDSVERFTNRAVLSLQVCPLAHNTL